MLAIFIPSFDSFLSRPLLKITFLMVYEEKNCCFFQFVNNTSPSRTNMEGFVDHLEDEKKLGM